MHDSSHSETPFLSTSCDANPMRGFVDLCLISHFSPLVGFLCICIELLLFASRRSPTFLLLSPAGSGGPCPSFLGSRVLRNLLYNLLRSHPLTHAQPFFFSPSGLLRPSCTAYTHCDLLCAPLILHLVTIPTFDPPTIRLFASDSSILPINRPFICTPLRAAAGLSVLSPFHQKPMSSGSWVLDRGHGHRHCNPSISAAAG